MSSLLRPFPAAATRQVAKTRSRRCLLIAAALTIQGCATAPPQPLVGPDAADPDVRVSATVYRSALGDFRSARPSEPAGWRERNDGAAPQPKKDGP